MKTPYLEIIKKENGFTFFLIEDLSYKEEAEELFDNYHNFWNLTNKFLIALEHYFKFESINSIKECLDLKKEIDKCYKRNFLKEEDSIYKQILSNPEFEYRSFIYESKDLPDSSIKLSFLDTVKVIELNTAVNNTQNININALPTKPGRGQKLCKNKECNMVIGARSLKCKFCGKV